MARGAHVAKPRRASSIALLTESPIPCHSRPLNEAYSHEIGCCGFVILCILSGSDFHMGSSRFSIAVAKGKLTLL